MKNKIWYNINIATRNGEKCFQKKDGIYESWDILAKVKSKGLAYRVAKEMENIYSKEDFIIVVE